MEESYRWDDDSYDRIAATGIPWQIVARVLRTQPRVRWHIGGVLRVAAPVTDWITSDAVWIGVALIEEADDQYLIVGARQLDSEEAAACRKMLNGGTT